MGRCCSNCMHCGQFTMNDVECCNCCENYNFFEPVDGKESEDEQDAKENHHIDC